MIEGVIVAFITAIGGILTVLIQRTREENKEDHGKVMSKLIDLHKDIVIIDHKVENVEHKINEHIRVEHFEKKEKSKKK